MLPSGNPDDAAGSAQNPVQAQTLEDLVSLAPSSEGDPVQDIDEEPSPTVVPSSSTDAASHVSRASPHISPVSPAEPEDQDMPQAPTTTLLTPVDRNLFATSLMLGIEHEVTVAMARQDDHDSIIRNLLRQPFNERTWLNWQFSLDFLAKYMERQFQPAERWSLARSDAESLSLRLQDLGAEELNESEEAHMMEANDVHMSLPGDRTPRPFKFIPHHGSMAEQKLRWLKDKHNEREDRRKARRAAEQAQASAWTPGASSSSSSGPVPRMVPPPLRPRPPPYPPPHHEQ